MTDKPQPAMGDDDVVARVRHALTSFYSRPGHADDAEVMALGRRIADLLGPSTAESDIAVQDFLAVEFGLDAGGDAPADGGRMTLEEALEEAGLSSREQCNAASVLLRAARTPSPNPESLGDDVVERSRIVRAFLATNGQTHTRWATYFEQNPSVEAEYVATGTWDDAKEHRRLESGYENALAVLDAFCSAHEADAATIATLQAKLERVTEALRPYTERRTVREVLTGIVSEDHLPTQDANEADRLILTARAALSNQESGNGAE